MQLTDSSPNRLLARVSRSNCLQGVDLHVEELNLPSLTIPQSQIRVNSSSLASANRSHQAIQDRL